MQSDETCQVYWERGEGTQLTQSAPLNSVSAPRIQSRFIAIGDRDKDSGLMLHILSLLVLIVGHY